MPYIILGLHTDGSKFSIFPTPLSFREQECIDYVYHLNRVLTVIMNTHSRAFPDRLFVMAKANDGLSYKDPTIDSLDPDTKKLISRTASRRHEFGDLGIVKFDAYDCVRKVPQSAKTRADMEAALGDQLKEIGRRCEIVGARGSAAGRQPITVKPAHQQFAPKI